MSNFRKSLLQRYPMRNYIQSTGDQYIDTGITFTKDTGTIEIKFMPAAVDRTDYNGVAGENRSPQISWDINGWYLGTGDHSANPYLPKIGQIYTATWGYDTDEHLFIDGQDTGLSRSGTFHVLLFHVEDKSDNSKAKLFYCKIYDTKGNITHYFVPCLYRGVKGLWDRIEKKFYSNLGTSEFLMDGCEIEEIVFYKCIKSTGVQYIDTNLTFTQDTGTIEIKFSPTEISSSGSAGTGYNGVIGKNSSPQIGWYPGGWTIGNAGSSLPYLPEVDKIYTATWGYDTNAKLLIDGQDTGLSRTGTMSVILFYVASEPDNAKVKVYYCKIYDKDGNLKHYFVPCAYNNVICMLDKVTNIFYYNTGSGIFLLDGEEAPEPVFYDYIQSTGTQYINTKLTITKDTGTIEIKFSPTEVRSSSDTPTSVYNGVVGENSAPQIGWNVYGWTVGNAVSTIPYMPEVGKTYIATWGCNTNEHLFIDDQDTGLSRSGTLTVKLFYVASNPGNAKVKLYYCKIYDVNGNLTHYFVPCTYQNVPGLWDNIENKFYWNDGTGTFIKGNKIE